MRFLYAGGVTASGADPLLLKRKAPRAVEAQILIDRILKPFEDLLVQAVADHSASRVLDVGCGTGGVTLAVAQRLGPEGCCVGVDISDPMIAAAWARIEGSSASARFICADAQTYAFDPESVDMVASRFGVMFFNDFVQAFTNLRRAAKPGAELMFIAWRSAAEKTFMTAAERAATPLLPDLPARSPDAPGQFAFADEGRVRRILQESGWTGIDMQPLDAAIAFPASSLEFYFTRLGPVAKSLHETDEQTRAQIIETVRAAFDPYVYGAGVRFNAACWAVSASVNH